MGVSLLIDFYFYRKELKCQVKLVEKKGIDKLFYCIMLRNNYIKLSDREENEGGTFCLQWKVSRYLELQIF